MQIELGNRLQTVASFVPLRSRLADIGSDHAYLPAYLVQNGRIDFAVAGEVVQGPFESAKRTVSSSCLDQQIVVRMGDGLDVLQPEDRIESITICGMGGELIASILERGFQNGHLSGQETLILQPNVAEFLVRQWLANHQYEIVEECVVEDQKRLYEIIVARPSQIPCSYSALDIQYGPILLKCPTDLCIQKWQRQQLHLEAIIEQLKQSKGRQTEKMNEFTRQLMSLKEVLNHANGS